MTSAIDILLSTYNGAAYLAKQLDSLFAQTCQDWRLVVRDDGATDATREILGRYLALHPGRIVILPQDWNRLGASASFATLLAPGASLPREERPHEDCAGSCAGCMVTAEDLNTTIESIRGQPCTPATHNRANYAVTAGW